MARRARISLILIVTMAVTVSGARAAVIGRGAVPSTAVSPDGGTAYIAYNRGGGGVTLCVWPRRARGCRARLAIPGNGFDPAAQPPLVSAPGDRTVRIVSDRGGSVFDFFHGDELFTSVDGGLGFTGTAPFADALYFDGAFGPGGEVLLDQAEIGLSAEVASPAAPDLAGADDLIPVRTLVNSAGGWAGATPVLVAGPGDGMWAYHLARPAAGNTPRAWSRRRVARSDDFAVGGRGRALWLLENVGAGTGAHLVISRYDGGRFVGAHRLPRLTGSADAIGVAVTEDAHGRLLAVWYDALTRHVEVAVGTRGGRRWTGARTLPGRVVTPDRLSVAVDGAGAGLVSCGSGDTGLPVDAWRMSISALLRR